MSGHLLWSQCFHSSPQNLRLKSYSKMTAWQVNFLWRRLCPQRQNKRLIKSLESSSILSAPEDLARGLGLNKPVCCDTDVSLESKVSSLPASEKSRECERQVQELQSPVAAGQLQLTETEANHRAETESLQQRLEAVSEAPVQPRYAHAAVGQHPEGLF